MRVTPIKKRHGLYQSINWFERKLYLVEDNVINDIRAPLHVNSLQGRHYSWYRIKGWSRQSAQLAAIEGGYPALQTDAALSFSGSEAARLCVRYTSFADTLCPSSPVVLSCLQMEEHLA